MRVLARPSEHALAVRASEAARGHTCCPPCPDPTWPPVGKGGREGTARAIRRSHRNTPHHGREGGNHRAGGPRTLNIPRRGLATAPDACGGAGGAPCTRDQSAREAAPARGKKDGDGAGRRAGLTDAADTASILRNAGNKILLVFSQSAPATTSVLSSAGRGWRARSPCDVLAPLPSAALQSPAICLPSALSPLAPRLAASSPRSLHRLA